LALEKELAVAFLGPVGTFSSMASRAKFGDSVDYLPQRGIADVFKEVDQERADYGVVPVENSTGGAIDDTLDAFCQYSRIRIVGEILLEVHLNLLSNGPLEKIQRVYTMRPPYEQCKGWLSNHLPQAKIVEVSSTAQAAEAAAKEENAAAIASLEAATLYGVEVRASAIEDQTFNVTRFLVIGKHDAQPTGHDKTSVIVSIKDGIGALQDMLLPLKTYGINMTRIESRPARQGSWDYLFFMDFQGHAKEEKVAAALKEMGETTRRLTVLGSYPAANG